MSIVNKFLVHGSLDNRNRVCCGRKRSKRAAEGLRKIRESISKDGKKSLRKVAQETGCSRSTAQRALRSDLGMTPYKIPIHQRLEERNRQARMACCAWSSRKCDRNASFDKIWFSDESHFYLLNVTARTIASGQIRDLVHFMKDSAVRGEVHSMVCHQWRGRNRAILVRGQ